MHGAALRARFTGKSVIVTGAAQGIGRGVALAMADEGGDVLGVDRSALVHELPREARDLAGAAHAFEADLETFAGAQAMAVQALSLFGRIDALVNVVGGTIWMRPFEHYGEVQIEAEIRRSLFPTLWGCRAVLPSMLAQRRGVIVNVSSIATRGIHRVPYAAAKGGVNAITASLAMEHADHGIRINATAPGGTDAPPRRIPRNEEALGHPDRIWQQAVVEQTRAASLMHRYGSVAEQVAPILFLASDEASYITGSVLPVGGGDQG